MTVVFESEPRLNCCVPSRFCSALSWNLRIRQSTILDYSTTQINKICNRKNFVLYYCSDNAKDFVGEYDIEQEGDYFYLVK